jgi:hypothetical protein
MREVQNGSMTIVVKRTLFKGKKFLDVRNFYTDKDGELKPTQKGLMIPADLAHEVLQAMDEELNRKKKVSR